MIWNGTDPLQPDHEVAYRGWPKERIKIISISDEGWGDWVVLTARAYRGPIIANDINGRYSSNGVSSFDLIPLQQEPAK